MTDREQIVTRRILDYLESLDGGAAVESLIQANTGLNMTPRLTLAEFESRLRFCETQKWIVGIHSKISGAKWAISDDGRAALAQM